MHVTNVTMSSQNEFFVTIIEKLEQIRRRATLNT
jgi:hypothetical protein